MKHLISLLLLSFPFTGYGQGYTKPVVEWKSLFYLDSVNVDLSNLHFDENKVASVDVVQDYYDSTKHIHGKIYINSKEPKSYHFMTISDVMKTFNKDIQKPAIFMLGNEFLQDTSKFKIDSSYILSVEVTAIDYLKNTVPDLKIFKIITKTKENVKKKNEIRIRGALQTAMK